MSQPILLTHWRSPGDITCLTAAVRDLTHAHPGRYQVHVAGSCTELWEGNPHIAGAWGASPPRGLPLIPIDYRRQLAVANETRRHFLTAFHDCLEGQLGVPVPVRQPHGDLHLLPLETEVPLVEGRYWYFVAGGKADIRTKIWPEGYSQSLIPLLGQYGIRIVQGGARSHGHEHPRLQGVIDWVGKTTLRDVLRMIYHADGIICPVTFAMHAAAALAKPCVVISGGREPWWWEAYLNSSERHFGPQAAPVEVPHRFLHTQGELDCCRDGGCWKTQLPLTSQIGQNDCVAPALSSGNQVISSCLASITPELVTEAVLSYYREGVLPPLDGSAVRSHPEV